MDDVTFKDVYIGGTFYLFGNQYVKKDDSCGKEAFTGVIVYLTPDRQVQVDAIED